MLGTPGALGKGQAELAMFHSCMPNSLLSQKILVFLLSPSVCARPSTNHPCLSQGDLHHRLQHHRWWSQSPSDQNQEPGQVSADLELMLCLGRVGPSVVWRLLSCLSLGAAGRLFLAELLLLFAFKTKSSKGARVLLGRVTNTLRLHILPQARAPQGRPYTALPRKGWHRGGLPGFASHGAFMGF